MKETMEIIKLEFGNATIETIQMVMIAMLAAVVFGMLIGLVLHLTANPLFYKNRTVNTIAGTIVNIIRSMPFIILLVVLLPLTRILVGTSIGATAAAVPLSIASVAFYARLVEGSFSEVDKGVVEAAVATGASVWLIIRKVLFVEALPSLIRGLTVTFVSIIGYSAMAGSVGGGGIGDLAIRYGYNRYETGVLTFTVIVLIIIVQLGQWLGDKVALKFTKR